MLKKPRKVRPLILSLSTYPSNSRVRRAHRDLSFTELKSAQRQDTEQSETIHIESNEKPISTKQAFEAFLVLDVEGTCEEGSSFDYPNEIIVRTYSFRL